MKRFASVGFVLVVLCFLAEALAASPAQLAETVRSSLMDAQLQLMVAPATASRPLARAEAAYGKLRLDALDPAADKRAREALDEARVALTDEDEAAFAAARARLWTTLLRSSFDATLKSIEAGDTEGAATWLVLREFRQATRFSRPGADATLALRRWQAGKLSGAEALEAVRNDLFDTYQARLGETLADVAAARGQGFSVRVAESSALAAGYFGILEPSYREQRGTEATAALRRAFARGNLEGIRAGLEGFRAAPLSAEEQQRRAGQLLRFLSLVPIEYSRGIRGGEVAVDLELSEAISFQDAAAAAFADIEGDLTKLDAALTEQASSEFATVNRMLEAARQRTAVAEPRLLQASVERLTQTLKAVLPSAWLRQNSSADFDVIEEALSQLEAAVATGAYAQAEAARIEAYAILESGPEAKLTAFAPQFVLPIENAFWYGQEPRGLAYLLSRHAPLAEIQATRAALSSQLQAAEAAIGGSKAPGSIATNAAIIVFREGLEAVLILASLLGSLKLASMKRFRKPLWVGVWSALVASTVTFLILRGALMAFAQFG